MNGIEKADANGRAATPLAAAGGALGDRALPSPAIERQACQLSADIYLPKEQLQAKYPGAEIFEKGCDRGMVVMLVNTIWAVFMGTHDLASLLNDFDVRRRSVGLTLNPNRRIECHKGFANGVEALFWDMADAVKSRSGEAYDIIITGHSRGGSQAEIFAAAFVDQFPAWDDNVKWVLPIAPARPGNAAFRDWYNKRLGPRTVFYQHGLDCVPWETPWFLGNRHVGCRVWFPEGGVATPLAAAGGALGERALPLRRMDPPLLELAIYCALHTAAGWRRGQISQLADHHIDTYLPLFP